MFCNVFFSCRLIWINCAINSNCLSDFGSVLMVRLCNFYFYSWFHNRSDQKTALEIVRWRQTPLKLNNSSLWWTVGTFVTRINTATEKLKNLISNDPYFSITENCVYSLTYVDFFIILNIVKIIYWCYKFSEKHVYFDTKFIFTREFILSIFLGTWTKFASPLFSFLSGSYISQWYVYTFW